MTYTQSIPESESQQPAVGNLPEELRNAARAALSWDVVVRPETTSTFPARVATARRALKRLEHRLVTLHNTAPPVHENPGSSSRTVLLELRENRRILRTAATVLLDCTRSLTILPRVVISGLEEPRIAAVAAIYLRAVENNFSVTTLSIFLRELQSHEPLAVDELWNTPAFLQFTLLEFILTRAQALLDTPEDVNPPQLSHHIGSLRNIGLADWVSLIEPHIVFDQTLRKDPAQTYAAMDFDSREIYRRRVASIARHSDHSESEVAQTALDLALAAGLLPVTDPRVRLRHTHIGYYLIDDGFDRLASRVGFHPPLVQRLRTFLRAHPDDFYITGIQLITILFATAAIVPIVPHATVLSCLALVLLMLLPSMQNAVELVNSGVTAIFDPQPLPKLDFSQGIPAECSTLVTVPTLLLNETQVHELVTHLEVRFLANRDPHLHFALLTDLPDSVTKPHDHDSHPLVELAIHLIGELNAKYGPTGNGSFLLLHRNRIFNRRQGVWMGWERKRGKLLDLNKLLVGEYDAFPIKTGPLDALQHIRYILTLDSDTQLPRGAAARMIGAIAHPLNQAIINPKLRIVTAGYGILQPRIGVTVQSASRSRLAAIYSGKTGFDIYARAISDAYQDLYGEGSFTGKGIYEVATLHTVLDRRFPRNSLLSHDLIEGAYARAGLTTDIELIDDYPSHLSAYNRRKHRWVRGDWQIVQWMFSRVPEESGRLTANPISAISRWKIFDNLRRSLVDPFTFLLFLVAWLGPTGGPLYWTIVALGLLFFPPLVQFAFSLLRGWMSDGKSGVAEAFTDFSQAMFITVLNLVFLPQQAMLALDAIVRSLVRRYITGERLLEWETAAQAETGSAHRTPVDRYLTLTPIVAAAVAALVYFKNPHSAAILVASPILVLWGLATLFTKWLNAPPREQNQRLGAADESFLLVHALRIWRYFHQFGSARHNYLIPDNVEEDGLFEAARVSPTNVGLLLNVRQAACEFGFLTVPEFAALTNCTLSSIMRLEKHQGHLYNWYDTESLAPLNPRMVSSVDSGNFVASLYTLHCGALDLLKQPLLSHRLLTSLSVFWQLPPLQQKRPASLKPLALPSPSASVSEWLTWLGANRAVLTAAEASPELTPGDSANDSWWVGEIEARVQAILLLLREYMPWMLAEYAPLRELPLLNIREEAYTLTIEGAAAFSETLENHLALACEALESGTTLRILGEQLAACIPSARRKLNGLSTALQNIAQTSERLAEETKFSFLIDPARKLLSIGYDSTAAVLHASCYDMLASEARIATFLAIARGELPQESWFKMGREHAPAFGHFLLFSWTGTMFEYLMPALWMRNYPETLIARTLTACVRIQIAFARSLKIPWGISESGFALQDEAGHYQYQAFGVPAVALKFEATAGPVVSPYSTFLALSVDSLESLRNLRRMESLGWVGAYGFYEAADYSATPRTTVLVREWMAHHQGMSLLAILNLLNDNVVQKWFHANPLIQSTELLLHEMPARKAALAPSE